MARSLSPYQITWIEFIPDYGKVTRHDQRLFGGMGKGLVATFRQHFPSREAAEKWVANFDASKLDKSYSCRYFTDKQFAMATAENDYKIAYTQKQIAETFKLEANK